MISSELTNGSTIVVNYSYDNRLSYILFALCCKTIGIPDKLSYIDSLISRQEYQETNLLTYKEEEAAPPPESPKPVKEEPPVETEEPPEPIIEAAPQPETIGDLLVLFIFLCHCHCHCR